MGSYYRVEDGKAALEQLRSSIQIKNVRVYEAVDPLPQLSIGDPLPC